jgi:hypothetical protein
MPFIEACKQYVGRSLFVLPYYGYGWKRKDSAAPPKVKLDTLGPLPFHLPVKEFVSCDSQLMGISGTIDEPEHDLNGYWCCCLLRNTDDSDFTEHPGQYMIWIAKKSLPVHPSPYPEKALYEWVTFDKSEFCLFGYGAVAESAEWIQDIVKRTMNSRKLVAGQAG